jgi:hypothetical protein
MQEIHLFKLHVHVDGTIDALHVFLPVQLSTSCVVESVKSQNIWNWKNQLFSEGGTGQPKRTTFHVVDE